MKRWLVTPFACWIAVQALPLQAAPAPQQLSLEPTSDWVVDYADERCAMTRRFGDGDNMVYLRIETYSTFTGFRYVLFGKPIPGAKALSSELKYGFQNEPPTNLSGPVWTGTIGGLPFVSFGATIQPKWDKSLMDFRGLSTEQTRERWRRMNTEAEEFEKVVDRIQVELNGRTTIDLHVGNMGKPMEALRACQDDLLRHWGLDPKVQRNLSRTAYPDPSPATKVHVLFPPAMVGRVALVPVRVLVDAEGNALNCVIQDAAVEKAFATAVCAELGKKFVPALDDTGKPVASVFQDNLTYQAKGSFPGAASLIRLPPRP